MLLNVSLHLSVTVAFTISNWKWMTCVSFKAIMTLWQSSTCLKESTSISFLLMASGFTIHLRYNTMSLLFLQASYSMKLKGRCIFMYSRTLYRPGEMWLFLTIYFCLFVIYLLQPVVTSQMGTINNLIQVKKSDFEVFDALQVDSLECSDTSGELFVVCSWSLWIRSVL